MSVLSMPHVTFETCVDWLCGKEIAVEHHGATEIVHNGFRCDACSRVVHAACASGTTTCDACKPPVVAEPEPDDLGSYAVDVHRALARLMDRLKSERNHIVLGELRMDVAEWQASLNSIVATYRERLADTYGKLGA